MASRICKHVRLYTETYMYELLKLVLFNACLGQIAAGKKRGSHGKTLREMLCLHVTVVAPPYVP